MFQGTHMRAAKKETQAFRPTGMPLISVHLKTLGYRQNENSLPTEKAAHQCPNPRALNSKEPRLAQSLLSGAAFSFPDTSMENFLFRPDAKMQRRLCWCFQNNKSCTLEAKCLWISRSDQSRTNLICQCS